jgi:hypothetical protein
VRVRRARVLMLLLLAAVMILGCAREADITARFLRYTTLQDGTRVAVVSTVASGAEPEEQTAYTDISDLETNETVVVRWVGRSWETPQWMPEREIVSRLARR